jgi:hypothetical protein
MTMARIPLINFFLSVTDFMVGPPAVLIRARVYEKGIPFTGPCRKEKGPESSVEGLPIPQGRQVTRAAFVTSAATSSDSRALRKPAGINEMQFICRSFEGNPSYNSSLSHRYIKC